MTEKPSIIVGIERIKRSRSSMSDVHTVFHSLVQRMGGEVETKEEFEEPKDT